MSASIVNGNALALPLADNSVQCVVTSPPYWGLRDYGVAGQLGLEPVPDCLGWATGQACGECYVCHMVAVFREVRRVLRDDGTVWCNLGDSYAQTTTRHRRDTITSHDERGNGGAYDYGFIDNGMSTAVGNIKPKDLIGIPWRVAFALQADGWWLRSDIIWAKPNPMPESVTDRPTKAHEYLFLLAKSSRYYYDAEAVKEPNTDDMVRRAAAGHTRGANGKVDASRNDGATLRGDDAMAITATGRNRRTVWTIATAPYSGAHFATFPPKLVEPCLLAGSSERGACPHCGAPWARVVEREGGDTEADERPKQTRGMSSSSSTLSLSGNGSKEWAERGSKATTTGWAATCACPPHEPRPCVVLDPFSGSGTVGRVAVQHRRRFVGVELNPAYIALAEQRTGRVQVEMAL